MVALYVSGTSDFTAEIQEVDRTIENNENIPTK
jgi:hypothetical protein